MPDTANDMVRVMHRCIAMMRVTLDSHGCIDCQEAGTCDLHGRIFTKVERCREVLAQYDELRANPPPRLVPGLRITKRPRNP